MGYDIYIGKVKPFDFKEIINEANNGEGGICLNYKITVEPCEGDEPDNITSSEFTIHKGPTRSPSYSGWSEFMNCHPSLIKINEEYISPRSSDGWTFLLNVKEIKDLLNDLDKSLENLTPLNKDRAKWLIFWTRKAIELYGNEAAISFH